MSFSDSNFSFVMYCGGSSKLVEPSTTSLLKLLVNLWQTRSSDRVAPPIMNTKMRCPSFLNSVEALFNTESLGVKKDMNYS
jgi:hypothetical protein